MKFWKSLGEVKVFFFRISLKLGNLDSLFHQKYLCLNDT